LAPAGPTSRFTWVSPSEDVQRLACAAAFPPSSPIRPVSVGSGKCRAGWAAAGSFLVGRKDLQTENLFYLLGMSARPVRKPAVVRAQPGNKDAALQGVLSGSDGTRTRDLRRDRCVETVASDFV
jgi:hypothetical protein